MSEFFDTPLADVIALQNDKKSKLKTSEYQSSGLLPIIDQSSKFICGYTDDYSKKYSKALPVIVFGDHTLHTKYIDFDFAVGADGTQIIKTKDPHHEHKYLYYVISREIQIMGSEGYKRHLKILKDRVVPFSNSISEQKKIASILTSVDEVIENTQQQIDKLQDLKKATMNELLTKGIGHTEFKDSELGRIPKSWEVSSLGECFSLTSGKSKPKRLLSSVKTQLSKVPVYGGNGVTGYTDSELLDEKTIVIGRVGEYCGCVHLTPKLCWITDNALYIKSITRVFDLSFMFHLMVFSNLAQLQSKGGQPLVSQKPISEFVIALPPIVEQQKIASFIDAISSNIDNQSVKLSQTQSLKKSLMQDLLTGKVRVAVN